jgi:hypothetical protein
VEGSLEVTGTTFLDGVGQRSGGTRNGSLRLAGSVLCLCRSSNQPGPSLSEPLRSTAQRLSSIVAGVPYGRIHGDRWGHSLVKRRYATLGSVSLTNGLLENNGLMTIDGQLYPTPLLSGTQLAASARSHHGHFTLVHRLWPYITEALRDQPTLTSTSARCHA